MKSLFVFLLLLICAVGKSQTVTIMDFVKVKEGKQAEAMYFYEQNWKIYREIAIKKGFITAYSIEKTQSDSAAAFNLILITEYKDTAMQAKSEENFRDILTTARPNGPVLLTELKPADFRENIFVKVTENILNVTGKRKKNK